MTIEPRPLIETDRRDGAMLDMARDHTVYHEAAMRLVGRGRLPAEALMVAIRQQRRSGSDLPSVLTANGAIQPVEYYRVVAEVYGLPFVDLREHPVDEMLIDLEDRGDYAELRLMPWRREDGQIVIATTAITPEHCVWADKRFSQSGYRFVITPPFDILEQSQSLFSGFDSFVAREGLFAWKPEHSAKISITRRDKWIAVLLLIVLAAALFAAPQVTLIVLMSVLSTFYTLTFLFKFVLTWVGASRSVDIAFSDSALAALQDYALPTYTVLVPMYREAAVLPLLARALKNLDYPASKLDVKLVLEQDDIETIEAAKALRLPRNFEIVRVPTSYPKTKPKACNYALQYCRSEFVTIYDAEDQPEPDQLKKAVLAFAQSDSRLACVQARLNYFNRSENWLTRMFTLEYSQWFDFLLPGLDWLKVPIPLGGTSNHFRLSALRAVGAWDPYNVTEDADLGVRLAQEGYTVGVINSTTFEEANGVLESWIRQRSRWIKGYMQTWLVHMRHPVEFWRSVGSVGFIGFQFFIGGPPFVMLMNPVLWALSVATLLLQHQGVGRFFPEPFGSLALFNLFVSNTLLVYFGIVAALKRRYFDLVLIGMTTPFYWVLHSAASYKALWQLIAKPHYWEKTEHGTSRVTKQALIDEMRERG